MAGRTRTSSKVPARISISWCSNGVSRLKPGGTEVSSARTVVSKSPGLATLTQSPKSSTEPKPPSASGPLKLLTLIDEYTRECLSIDVARHIRSDDVLHRLAFHCVRRGCPEHLRSDNGPEFTAVAVRRWLARVGVQTLFIEPGSPWENGYCESFNGKLRDECLNRELFTTLLEAHVVIEQWRREYNTIRPHSALGYRPPAPETTMPLIPGSATLCPGSAINHTGLTLNVVQ